MPAPSSMNLGQAASEVMARIGQLDDGISNPVLLAEIKTHINAAQRKLLVEYSMLQTQRRNVLLPVAAGRRFVDLPTDARPGQIRSVVSINGSYRLPLMPGITESERGIAGATTHYDVTPTSAIVRVDASGGAGYTAGIGAVSGGSRLVDGHDPIVTFAVNTGVVTKATILDAGSQWVTAPSFTPLVGSGVVLSVVLGTIAMLELGPLPGQSMTLAVEYQAAVVPLVEDEDLLVLDPEAVISRAAVLMAVSKNLRSAPGLTQDLLSYMANLRSQQSHGRVMNLAEYRTKT
jgi:hypothetical protein